MLAALLPFLTACAQTLSTQGAKPASAPPAPARVMAAPATPDDSSPADAAVTAYALPSARDEAPGAGPVAAAQKLQPHIALILPLGSRTFAKVADAVKQGFLAGANADGKNAPPFRVYTADDDTGSLATQYRRAAAEGAAAIVGGVTRDGANIMARESSYLPNLALNAPANDSDLPDRFFYVSLNLDWEARLAARTAANDGLRRVAIITAGTPLAKRVQESFEKEWIRLGGEIAVRLSVSGDLSEGPRVTAAMEKATADVTFLAVEMRIARFVRPYLPVGIPVFSTSMTIDPRADAVENLDLESVRFMEMPWFVQPDHPAVMAYSKPAEPMPIDYERLYALGIDAWRLAQLVVGTSQAKNIPPLDGVTGRITLEGHQFVRMLASGEMRDGRPTLYKPSE
ncbi:MAG: penicillin-binding protein activator [Betaproteobacteria bacterium]